MAIQTPSRQELEFVRHRLDSYYSTHYFATVAKVPPFEPKDGGAPPSMWSGAVDAEGWVEWQMLPTVVADSDIVGVEQEFGVAFPSLFRAYLRSYCHLFDQMVCGDVRIQLPSIPADNPLGDLRSTLSAWRDLLPAHLLPFGDFEDGWGPLCFDTVAGSDRPVVWLEHELLGTLERPVRRSAVAHLIKPVSSSFRQLLLRLGS